MWNKVRNKMIMKESPTPFFPAPGAVNQVSRLRGQGLQTGRTHVHVAQVKHLSAVERRAE